MDCPFKVGEKIVCVKLCSIARNGSLFDKKNLGKIYTIIRINLSSGTNFPILEDMNGNRYLSNEWYCYISLSEQRRLKLEKLKNV